MGADKERVRTGTPRKEQPGNYRELPGNNRGTKGSYCGIARKTSPTPAKVTVPSSGVMNTDSPRFSATDDDSPANRKPPLTQIAIAGPAKMH